MIIEPVGLATILLGLLTLYRGATFGVPVVLCLLLFGASAAVILPALGGASVRPQHFFFPFFVLACLREPRIRLAVIEAFAFPRPAFWMLSIALYGLLTALLLPRIFLGMTEVFAISRDFGTVVAPLRPGSGNITQPAYLLSESVFFACMIAMATLHQNVVVRGLFIAGTLNLALAVVDLATYQAGLSALLDIFRNASYGQLSDGEIAGFKRITGLFPEASVFGAVTLGFYAFFSQLWLRGVNSKVSGPLALVSLAMLLFSTSSSVYAVLGVLILIKVVQSFFFVAAGRGASQNIVVLLLPFVCMIALIGLMMLPEVWGTLERLIDRTVFSKLDSHSGVERLKWNLQAWRNFTDTYGLGAGVGSVRASGFIFAILASVGVFGMAFFTVFFWLVFRPLGGLLRAGGRNAVAQAGALGCLAIFLSALLIANSIRLEFQFLSFAALAVTASWRNARSWRDARAPARPAASGPLATRRA